MTFRKNHAYRWKSNQDQPLDKQPISFKGRVGLREELKNIPDWQERFREFAEQLIAEANLEGG